MKNVVAYCRVSTSKQAEYGFSLEYQKDAIDRYCFLKNYNILAVHTEDYSAKDFDRPEWKKIISFIKENKGLVQSIVTLRFDRFSRDFTHSVNEIAKLTKMGVTIETVEVQIDMTTPEALLTRNIMLTLPQIENEKLSIRTQGGSHKARLNGCWTGTAPRVYKNCRVGKDSTLEYSEEAPIMKEAFEKLASGRYSVDEVRRWLNGKGVDICKAPYYNTIRNIVYTGKILVKAFKTEPQVIVKGLHPAIIDDEVFAAAKRNSEGSKEEHAFPR